MSVKVVNMKRYRGPCFRIDRRSPLGNEYTHLPLHLTRATFQVKTRAEAVTEGFNDIIRRLEKGDEEVSSYLADILFAYQSGKEIILGCWCDPQPCHGHPIRDAVVDGTFLKFPKVVEYLEIKNKNVSDKAFKNFQASSKLEGINVHPTELSLEEVLNKHRKE